jgi:NADH:quinone reductase (non-electrogenic)
MIPPFTRRAMRCPPDSDSSPGEGKKIFAFRDWLAERNLKAPSRTIRTNADRHFALSISRFQLRADKLASSPLYFYCVSWDGGFVGASTPRVVVVGGGFGGLFATRALAKAPVDVTLVDKRNYHLFRPMLYQVATGLLSADEIAGPLRSILSRQRNVEVLQDDVSGVDPQNRVVYLRQHRLSYDFLILATGIQYNYFGHDEWRRVAPGLESLDDADLIRGKVLTAFERAEEMAALDQSDPDAIKRLLTFVLVGAGTVGVEMAGTLAEMSRMALAHDFRHIDPRSAQILLYEAAPRVLPTFPEDLAAKAQRHLESLGVKVFTNTRVTAVDTQGIVADGVRVPAGTVLWGAGVLASPAGRWLGVPMDKSGKIIVNPDLSVPGHPEIFAIGDTAHVVAASRNLIGFKSKQPMVMPGVAQPAIQEGQYVARVIRRRVAGMSPPAPFWYWDKGDLAVVGRTYAIADLRFVRFSGFLAWIVWAAVHIYFLIGFANRFFVLLQWGIAFLTKRRQVRVFPGQEKAAGAR